MVQVGIFNWQTMVLDEVALLAKHNYGEAMSATWQRVIPQVQRVSGSICAKYPWVDAEDIIQNVLVEVPKLIRRWKPEKGKNFDRYMYFSIYRATQDALRRLDPLGVQIPQKKPYPSYRHLSEVIKGSHDGRRDELTVINGLDNLDRGHQLDLSSHYTAEGLTSYKRRTVRKYGTERQP